jgi:inorganic pyrophosphatase
MTKKEKSGSARSAKNRPSTFDVIIETPKGSRNKFKYDPDTRMFRLSKVLPEGMVFPYDFGFVPSTVGDDGDPIDILVLGDEPTFPGCLLKCRLIGVIEADQEEKRKRKRNDRLVAVAEQSLLYSDITHLGGLNSKVLEQVEDFFVNYQKVRNVRVTILGRQGPGRALEILRGAVSRNRSGRPFFEHETISR